MSIYDDAQAKNNAYTNWNLVNFLTKTTIGSNGELTWSELARLRPRRFGHIPDYLGDNLGQGNGIVSELRTLCHNCFWGSFASIVANFPQ